MIRFLCGVVTLVIVVTECQGQDRYRYPEYDYLYPQYLYRPYSYDLYGPNNCNEDCNRQYYPRYARYLLYFRERWSERDFNVSERYGKAQRLWESYGRYEVTGKPKGPKPKPKKRGCCWEFKKLPKREVLNDYPTGRVRIEYRQLTAEQRTSLHNAFNALKDNGVYDFFVSRHNGALAPNAHSGAAFLPWHREFLFRLENALYAENYSGPGLPYWDNTLDQDLPTPSDSAIWTPGYLGNIDGNVITGFAADWESSPGCLFLGPFLRRNGALGADGNCLLMNDFDINYVYSKRCFRDIVCNNDCKFESDHAGVHNFVGGHMGDPFCAPNDPVFFLHHAFIDCIWEFFRQTHQESNIYKEYPHPGNGDDIGGPGHAFDADMLPFGPLLNGHGIEKFYEAYYKCRNRPMRCRRHSHCNSPLLWCNNGRCKAKVKNGGDCTGLPDVACYCTTLGITRCVNNRCSCGGVIVGPIAPVQPVQPIAPVIRAPPP